MTTLATHAPSNRMIPSHLSPEYPREGGGGGWEKKRRINGEQTTYVVPPPFGQADLRPYQLMKPLGVFGAADAAALVEQAHGLGQVLRGDDADDALALHDGDELRALSAGDAAQGLTSESSGSAVWKLRVMTPCT